jgi:hypothetical protein
VDNAGQCAILVNVFDDTKKKLAKYSSVLGEKPTFKEKNTTQSPPKQNHLIHFFLYSSSQKQAIKYKSISIRASHNQSKSAERQRKAAQFLQKLSSLLNSQLNPIAYIYIIDSKP